MRLGIDFGTTRTVVAAAVDGRVERYGYGADGTLTIAIENRTPRGYAQNFVLGALGVG